MTQSVTISVKGLLVAGVALMALVAAYLVGANGAPPLALAQTPAVAAAQGDEERPTLTMTGSGTATAVPDQLSFTLTARAKRDTLQAALHTSSTAMQDAQGKLEEYGVAAEDLATTGLEMNPEYNYPESGPAVLTGYRVTQRARVSISDLEAGGEAIAAVVRSGTSTVKVGDISLEVADTEDVLAEARDAAVAQARTKAEQYAAAADVDLGSVITIREVSRDQSNPAQIEARAQADEAFGVPIAAGEQEQGVEVEIIWSLVG